MNKDKKKKETAQKQAAENTAENTEAAQNTEPEAEAPDTVSEKPEEAAKPSECDKLKEELAAVKDKYLRIAAEYENYRRRTEKEKQMIYADATSDAIKEILMIGDSLERASEACENISDDSKKGIDMITNQYFAALKKLGVEPFGECGEKFDPELHNAVSATEDENAEKDTVIAVYQTGYKLGDRIIRHAMVQVCN